VGTLLEVAQHSSILVAAHRGYSAKYPENTFVAFDAAISVGADMIELDIQFTKDDHIVVYHDEYLSLTNQIISEHNYEDIKDYDVGSRFGVQFADERIPLLRDVLLRYKDKIYFIIEVKPVLSDQTKTNLQTLCDIINEVGCKQNCVLASFNECNLQYIKSIDANIHTAIILQPQCDLSNIKCDAVICSVNELNAITEQANKLNLFTGVYDAATISDVEECVRHGVKAIGTNDPDTIRHYLEQVNAK
jgi:glycerophosphoryl diester phosphodiesterase